MSNIQLILEMLAIVAILALLYVLIGLCIAAYGRRGYIRDEDEPMPRKRFWKIALCWGPMLLEELELYS